MHDTLRLDLLDFFRGVHSWRKFYALIGRLPAEGYYKSALAMDMDYARRLAAREEAQEEQPVQEMTPLRYGPVEQRLDGLMHGLLLVRAAVHATKAKDGKEPKVEPPRTPRTALDVARAELELKKLSDFASTLFTAGSPDVN